MIISVKWLMENAIFNDQRNETVPQMWERKFDELCTEFIDSVTEHGIQGAVIYDQVENRLFNGHHRLLVAWLLNVEYIHFVEEFEDNPEDYLMGLGWPMSYKENGGQEEGP